MHEVGLILDQILHEKRLVNLKILEVTPNKTHRKKKCISDRWNNFKELNIYLIENSEMRLSKK